MRKSLNTSDSKWYDNLWAALIFFTRLPLWRIHQPPRGSYSAVVEYWPLAGWITGGVMAAVLYLGSMVLPYPIAVLMAIASRLFLTGALHEDGLCDFFDGFGGGGDSRERILLIMKDSRIGTYGVIGLLIYVLLLAACLHYLTPKLAAITILAADPFSKMVAGQIIMMLPYARNEEEAKNRTVYRRMNTSAAIGLAIQGFIPLGVYIWLVGGQIDWRVVIFAPCIVMYFLYLLIWKRLRGYTGDCCGALCLLVELTFYIAVCGTIYYKAIST